MIENIEVIRLYRCSNEGPVKAFVDIAVAGRIIVKGIKIIEGKKGLFVGWPREKGQDGKWYPRVQPISQEASKEIDELIMEAYNVD